MKQNVMTVFSTSDIKKFESAARKLKKWANRDASAIYKSKEKNKKITEYLFRRDMPGKLQTAIVSLEKSESRYAIKVYGGGKKNTENWVKLLRTVFGG